MQTLGMAVAACSAAGFAVSTSLQHRSAGRAPTSARSTRALLGHLAGRPWWLLGQLVAMLSFALHALALRLGTIVTVQPVVVSGIVLAVPTRAALNRRLPSWGELATVVLTAVGLAVLLVASRPTTGQGAADGLVAAVFTAAGAGLTTVAVVIGVRCHDRHRAAAWLGVAAGVMFGVVAGLVKLAFAQAHAAAGPWAFAHSWALWAVPVVGLSGVAINQRAYRAARLSASMPILNIVDVVVALGFGVAVFHEVPRHGAGALAAEVAALACIALGLRRLSRSPTFDADASQADPAAPTPSADDVTDPRSQT